MTMLYDLTYVDNTGEIVYCEGISMEYLGELFDSADWVAFNVRETGK